MNIAELRTFLMIVETGSLVRASQVLNVTQSTVTARLKSLEDQLGQRLLVRNKSGASLTAAGMKLHRYADTICNLWQQARQETALPAGASAVCNIACEFDLWPGAGERFAAALNRQQPKIGVSIWLGSQTDVASWLAEGKSDLALTHRAPVAKHQGQLVLPSDVLVLVSSDPQAPTRFDPNYVFVDAGEPFGRDHAIAYADAGTPRLSFGNATLGLAHILQNGGSAYLPSRMVLPALEAGRLFLLDNAPRFERPVYLTFNKAARDGWHWLDDVLQDSLPSQAAAL